jgi:hypothetical protein
LSERIPADCHSCLPCQLCLVLGNQDHEALLTPDIPGPAPSAACCGMTWTRLLLHAPGWVV